MTASSNSPLATTRYNTVIPKRVTINCCASCQKLSPLNQPNRPPHPNQPPPPAPPPPPTSSLFLISRFHFSNFSLFPPSALSNAFLACSCRSYHEKESQSNQMLANLALSSSALGQLYNQYIYPRGYQQADCPYNCITLIILREKERKKERKPAKSE